MLSLLSLLSSALVYGLFLAAGLLAWFQWRHRELLRAAYKVPTVLPTLPIIGHAYLNLLGMEKTTEFAIKFSREAVAKGISVACFWCGPLPVFMVHGLEDIQTVLKASSALHKPTELTCLEKFLGYGLLTAPVDVWKVTRRYINHLFHPRNLDQLMPRFNRNSREFVDELRQYRGEKVDIMGDVMNVALKSVCHLIFGPDIEFDTKSESFKGLIKVVESIPHLFTIRAVRPWLRLDSVFYFLYRKELQKIDHLYKNFTEAPLKITRAKNEMKNKEASKWNSKQLTEEKQDLLKGPKNLVEVYACMQKNFPQFTEDHLKSEMVTLYGTGTDTTATAISSCLLTLAQYQDIQERLYREIVAVVGKDRDVSVQDLHDMPYLDMVYKETLRWFTVTAYAFRKTTEDIRLGSYTIPANNTIVISLGGILHDPNIFPNPEIFDPERFAAKRSLGKEKYAFLPFSGGPRNCIGQVYAHMFIKVVIVHILRNFKLSTDMDIHTMKRIINVTLVSSTGYNIKLEGRC